MIEIDRMYIKAKDRINAFGRCPINDVATVNAAANAANCAAYLQAFAAN